VSVIIVREVQNYLTLPRVVHVVTEAHLLHSLVQVELLECCCFIGGKRRGDKEMKDLRHS